MLLDFNDLLLISSTTSLMMEAKPEPTHLSASSPEGRCDDLCTQRWGKGSKDKQLINLCVTMETSRKHVGPTLPRGEDAPSPRVKEQRSCDVTRCAGVQSVTRLRSNVTDVTEPVSPSAC